MVCTAGGGGGQGVPLSWSWLGEGVPVLVLVRGGYPCPGLCQGVGTPVLRLDWVPPPPPMQDQDRDTTPQPPPPGNDKGSEIRGTHLPRKDLGPETSDLGYPSPC